MRGWQEFLSDLLNDSRDSSDAKYEPESLALCSSKQFTFSLAIKVENLDQFLGSLKSWIVRAVWKIYCSQLSGRSEAHSEMTEKILIPGDML